MCASADYGERDVLYSVETTAILRFEIDGSTREALFNPGVSRSFISGIAVERL